jgi:hypothetical protein
VRPAPPPRGPQLDPDTETFIILAVVGVGALLYTTAAAATMIGAFATGGGWVEAGWLDHGRALVSLPWHPGDPAAGYPPAAAADLSGPVVWWSVAGVVLAVLVGVATWAVVRIRQQRRRGGWARRRDLRALRCGSEGVLLGLHHGRPVAVEERHSTLVIGATQTHKTTGLAVPAILEADDLAVIALSVKDDIVSDTIGWRSTLPGRHWLFDPTDALIPRGGREGLRIDVDTARRLALRPRLIRSGWSPLAMTATWQGALLTAFDLAARRCRTSSRPPVSSSVRGSTRVAASSECCDLDPAAFFNGDPNTLYLVAPPSNQDRLRVVFNMVVKQFVDHAYAQVLASGRPLDRRVLVTTSPTSPRSPTSARSRRPLPRRACSSCRSCRTSRSSAVDTGPTTPAPSSTTTGRCCSYQGSRTFATLELASKLSAPTSGRRRRRAATDGTTYPHRELTRCGAGADRGPSATTPMYGHFDLRDLRGAELTLRPWFRHRRLRRRARFLPAGTGPLNPLPLDREEGRTA